MYYWRKWERFYSPFLFHTGRAACGALLEFYSQYFHSILMFLLFLKSQLCPHQVIESISDCNLDPETCLASNIRPAWARSGSIWYKARILQTLVQSVKCLTSTFKPLFQQFLLSPTRLNTFFSVFRYNCVPPQSGWSQYRKVGRCHLT